ncbi:hypothetical protein J5Y09_16625 [Roseomonas sp. PWR1]|uniref:Uncharacterized protein n=1 Tax=Roseomonas nitratireducens TaxID=2820810 RepID=A0ABS4AYF3_9PROT|nr:hypothetical protein [Neoroseomonas nitratireducens]MBP0465552.1 hypothetical protein [Neoroseomonas nitratireducens]
MTIPRRPLLLAALAAPFLSRQARAATTAIALRPGAPRTRIATRTLRGERGEAFAIAFGAQGEVRLPTWYGDGRVLRALPLAGREVLLAEFQGNRGTGVAQRLVAAIGWDDAAGLRILGIETLSFRDAQTSAASRRMTGTLEATAARDALLLRHETVLRRGRGPDLRETWTTRLAWSGAGLLAAPATPPRAGGMQRRVDAARARIHALLAAAPVTDATALDYDEAGLWAVGYAEPVS